MIVQRGDSIRSPHTLDRSPLRRLPAQLLHLLQEGVKVFSSEEAIPADRMADSLDLAGILPIPQGGHRDAQIPSGFGDSQDILQPSHSFSPTRPMRSTLPTLPALVVLDHGAKAMAGMSWEPVASDRVWRVQVVGVGRAD